MITSFTLKLNDTQLNRNKESLLNRLEILFDDIDNKIPIDYYWFIEHMEYGKRYKITFEELDE